MKKKILIFFLLMLLCFPIKVNAVVTNSSHNVKVNFFLKNDCKDCKKEKEWLEEYKKNNFINIEYIDVKDNKELYNKTRKALSIKSNKTPLVIIGSNYFLKFNNKTKEELTKAITSYEKANDFCDIVTKIRNNENIKNCINKNRDIYNQSTLKKIIIYILIFILLSL